MVFSVLLYLQVSWTESHDDAKNGRRTVNFYDEEGTSAIRKVHVLWCEYLDTSLTEAIYHSMQSLRYGEKASAKPLFSADVDHRVSSVGQLESGLDTHSSLSLFPFLSNILVNHHFLCAFTLTLILIVVCCSHTYVLDTCILSRVFGVVCGLPLPLLPC